VLGGVYACAQILDGVSNAITLIPLGAAIKITVLIAALWVVAEIVLSFWKPLWRCVDGSAQRIVRMGPQPRLFVLGVVFLLWVPQIIDWSRESTPTPQTAKNPEVPITAESPKAQVVPEDQKDQPKTSTPEEQPKKAAAKASPLSGHDKSSPHQTMTNSPGGIQAGRDVILNSDRRIVHTMTVRVVIETETPPAKPGGVETSTGLYAPIAFSTKEKARIRFTTDAQFQEHQVTETRKRFMFNYIPETPEQILGKPIEDLANIDVLAVNYAEFLREVKLDATKAAATVKGAVSVNGVAVGTFTLGVPPGHLTQVLETSDVAPTFAGIPAAYAAAVARQ